MSHPSPYIAIWRYRVKPDKVSAFVNAYAAGGAWGALFGHSPEYIATTLVGDRTHPGVYVTIDEWKSRAGFDDFKVAFAAKYAELDRVCDALTESEELILEGTYPTSVQAGAHPWRSANP